MDIMAHSVTFVPVEWESLSAAAMGRAMTVSVEMEHARATSTLNTEAWAVGKQVLVDLARRVILVIFTEVNAKLALG